MCQGGCGRWAGGAVRAAGGGWGLNQGQRQLTTPSLAHLYSRSSKILFEQPEVDATPAPAFCSASAGAAALGAVAALRDAWAHAGGPAVRIFSCMTP